MGIEDDVAALEKVPVLKLLGNAALRVLAIGAESRRVHAGDTLFREGDEADCGYVIQQGQFSVTGAGTGDGMVVGPGVMFGEMALVVETRRTVTAKAIETSTVIRLSRNLFQKVLESHPDAAQRLRDNLHDRTAEFTGDIAALRGKLQ